MKATTRREKIKKLLDIYGSVEVSNLAQTLNVSMETIRRDLDILCQNYDIKKIHGGAIKNNTSSTDYFFNKRINKNLIEKKKIAKIASELIEDYDVIAIDTGTTVLQLIDYIYDKNISIVTNSFPVINALSKYNISHLKGKVIFLGGEFNENSLSTYGEIAINMLNNLNISKSFISCDSFSIERGISFHNIREASFTKEFIRKCKTSYLLIDSDKFIQDSFYTIGQPSIVDTIVSSSQCPEDFNSIFPNTNWIYTE